MMHFGNGDMENEATALWCYTNPYISSSSSSSNSSN